MGLIAYGLIALAIMGALGGLYGTVHHSGVNEGRAEVQALWNKANKIATERRDKNRMAAELTAKTSAAELAAAQQKSDDYRVKWLAERKKHADTSLAGCVPASPVASTEGQATPLPAPPAIRFSWGFLRSWDSAWTGDTGQPVFGNQSATSGQPADTPDALTAIGPGEVLDNHALNAEACSKDRRALNSLIGQIEKLRAGWK